MSTSFLDSFLESDAGLAAVAPFEVTVDQRTGQARQAGSAPPYEGDFIKRLRERAECSLYVFAKGILRRRYLTSKLHKPTCDWLQTRPPDRKCLLLPREHAKTTLVGHALAPHILIQSPENNPYFPGQSGEDQRIVIAGETDTRSGDSLRVIKSALENNETLRALWPHRIWANPQKSAPKWNDKEIILPRREEYPDPSIRVIGVGGAVTGAHPTVLIKDDLVTLEAANSPTVMQTAIQWHVASRALINAPGCLEFIIGTRWAVNDLYEYIQTNDPSVEVMVRAVVEGGVPIFPEMFTVEKVAQLQAEFGVLFPLLYMNSAADPELVDFDTQMLREFTIEGRDFVFREDERDMALSDRLKTPTPASTQAAGQTLYDGWQSAYTPGEGFRLRG